VRDLRGRSIDGGRNIERGGHPRMRDWRGRIIDGGRSIERRESKDEGLEREDHRWWQGHREGRLRD
jgi:hypothetical protein